MVTTAISFLIINLMKNFKSFMEITTELSKWEIFVGENLINIPKLNWNSM